MPACAERVRADMAGGPTASALYMRGFASRDGALVCRVFVRHFLEAGTPLPRLEGANRLNGGEAIEPLLK